MVEATVVPQTVPKAGFQPSPGNSRFGVTHCPITAPGAAWLKPATWYRICSMGLST